MNIKKLILTLMGVFLLQFYLAEFLSINMIRPDFLSIFILYTAIRYGRFLGVLTGFLLGLVSDLLSVGTYLGLSSMIYSVGGYLAGFLKDQYNRLIPIYYHLSWLCILLFQFFVYCYFRYQYLYETSLLSFFGVWLLTSGYTLGFVLILQLLIPFRMFNRAESI